MEQFVVPQFIDVEDKIIGPLTVRQFIIMMVGGFVIFLEFRLADFGLFIFEGILTLFLVALLAFFKVNGMPFHFFLLNFLSTLRRPKVRVWQKTILQSELADYLHQPVPTHQAQPIITKPLLHKSRLAELALVVDTGGAYQAEEE
ncbi:MAG: PrgI family protein [Candidatus Veblenbacteria bacterium]|nr:PrgI family protein [Candidatus Veblenbacteria bacterium]